MTVCFFSRITRLALGTALTVAIAAPHTARARSEVSPYLELDQSIIADLQGGNGDVLTYTMAAVGVDASVQTRRMEAQVDLRYEHVFAWNKHSADSDLISGIAQGRFQIVPNQLSIEAGGMATRVRTDGLSGANNSLISAGSTSHIYSAYVGPTLTTEIGAMSVNAAYRLGYTRVDDNVPASIADVPLLGSYEDSVFQSATASIGMQPGNLPFGWSVGVGYDREDASQLDQRYEDKWVRADVTAPVSPTVAVVGGIGYEGVKISQRDVLRDINDDPVIDSGGRFVTDPDSPRLLAYDQDNLMWDVGVLWRPSRRTSLEARIGERYGSMHYIGSFSWQPSANSYFSLGYYDTIDSFGRSMLRNLDSMPTAFNTQRNPFSGDLTGCVQGENSAGTCFNDSLAGISSANYRHRGIFAQYGRHRGPWSWGLGTGYSQRKFIAPNSGIFASINGTKDENYFGEAFFAYTFDNASMLQTNIYGNYFNATVNDGDVTNIGSYMTYSRAFGRKLSAHASVGIDSVRPEDIEAIVTALGQFGLRYQF